MSDEKERTIVKQRLIICPRCQQPSRVPVTIMEGMLPVKLKCPRCNDFTVKFTDRIPELPKVEPPRKDQWWTVEQTEVITAEDEEEKIAKLEQGETSNRLATFAIRSGEIADNLMKGLELLDLLRKDITAFENAFVGHFTEATRLTEVFHNNWNPYYMKEFVYHPYTCVKIDCDNELASKYARLVVAPKFFKPNIGLTLPSNGGFCVEFINQFTLIGKPIYSIELCKYLEIPQPIDISLQGNKLMGSSLNYCWQDIPGTLQDGGHTADDPSLIIHPLNGMACRIWLAEHGIGAWSHKELADRWIRREEELLYFADTMEGNQANRQAWLSLSTKGRLGIFWNDIMTARHFAALAGNCIKGPKLILAGSEDDRDAWLSVGASFGGQTNNNFLFYPPDEATKLHSNAIRDIRLIILDSFNYDLYAVNSSVLKMLYNYGGALLIVGRDALFDFNTGGVQASMIYGLLNDVIFDNQDESVDWRKTIKWDSPILTALLNLRSCSQADLSE